jgi:hypothetical protein
MATGALVLDLVDVRGDGISDDVEITLDRQDNSTRYKVQVKVAKRIRIKDIECAPFAIYAVSIWPGSYRPVQFFIKLASGKDNTREPVVFPVDADAVTGIKAPAFASLAPKLKDVLTASNIDTNPGLSGKGLYEALDPVRKACLLNIHTKTSNTFLLDGSNCFDHIGGISKLRGDRFFAKANAAFREEVQNAGQLFSKVSGALHHAPDGYTDAGSFKTNDRHGNLQLSFFRKGTTGDDYMVDADIDEASGIEHGFEVIRNHLFRHTTSPYDVREILIAKQSLDPNYDFLFAKKAKVG